jgi:hypothetical protein
MVAGNDCKDENGNPTPCIGRPLIYMQTGENSGAVMISDKIIMSVGKDSKGKDKNSDAGSAVSISPLGEEEHYWKTRQILDHSWVKKTVLELRMCMERMVNRVFIIGNLG